MGDGTTGVGIFGGGKVAAPVVIGPDGGPVPADTTGFGNPTEAIWPRTVIAWLILSVVFLGLSVQFVSPTRRWRLRRGPGAVGSGI